MKNKNKIIIICLAAGIAFSMVSVTLAYLGTMQPKNNVITVGHDEVSIDEEFSSPDKMEMSNTTPKQINIKNTGSVPCYVRVFAEFSDSVVAADASVVTEKNAEMTWENFKNGLKLDQSPETISDHWRYVPASSGNKLGGYFYYTEKLLPGQTTGEPLIKSVKTDFNSAEDDNIDRIKDFDIIVYSETVQSTEIGGAGFEDNESGPAWKQAWESFLKVGP